MEPIPYLRSGTGTTPRDGGCVMQIVDWISRHAWTDQPPCVHPVLRVLAIKANDTLDDTRRQQLLDLVPRLMHTATEDRRVTVGLACHVARAVLPIYEARYPADPRPRQAIDAAERGDTGAAARAADAAWAAAADTPMALLLSTLDAYDRLTGRVPPTTQPDYTAVCAVMGGR